MDEVDVHPVDLGLELRQRVQPRLDPPEVVVGAPVAREFPQRRQLHALRPIGDELLAGPAYRRETAAEVGQVLFGYVDLERADGVGCSYGDPFARCTWDLGLRVGR